MIINPMSQGMPLRGNDIGIIDPTKDLARGLKLCWVFNQKSNIVEDLSGNGATGVATGMVPQDDNIQNNARGQWFTAPVGYIANMGLSAFTMRWRFSLSSAFDSTNTNGARSTAGGVAAYDFRIRGASNSSAFFAECYNSSNQLQSIKSSVPYLVGGIYDFYYICDINTQHCLYASLNSGNIVYDEYDGYIINSIRATAGATLALGISTTSILTSRIIFANTYEVQFWDRALQAEEVNDISKYGSGILFSKPKPKLFFVTSTGDAAQTVYPALATSSPASYPIAGQVGTVTRNVNIAQSIAAAYGIEASLSASSQTVDIAVASSASAAFSVTPQAGVITHTVGYAEALAAAYGITPQPQSISGAVSQALRSAASYTITGVPQTATVILQVAENPPVAHIISTQVGSVTHSVDVAQVNAQAYSIQAIAGSLTRNTGYATSIPVADLIAAQPQSVQAVVNYVASLPQALSIVAQVGSITTGVPEVLRVPSAYPVASIAGAVTRNVNFAYTTPVARAIQPLPQSIDAIVGFAGSAGQQSFDVEAVPLSIFDITFASSAAEAYNIQALPGAVSRAIGYAVSPYDAYTAQAIPGSVDTLLGFNFRIAEAYEIDRIPGDVTVLVSSALRTPIAYIATGVIFDEDGEWEEAFERRLSVFDKAFNRFLSDYRLAHDRKLGMYERALNRELFTERYATNRYLGVYDRRNK